MNPDEEQLLSHTVNPNGNIVEQVLRIACYDEYRANAYYQKVIDTYGTVAPFTNIVKAEVRHYSMLEQLCKNYAVTPPINDWYQKIRIGTSIEACCQDGVNAEIANIEMYDILLPYVIQDDIRDIFYREQAASYNNHLPAFRQCVQNYQSQNKTDNFNQQTKTNTTEHHDIYNMIQGMMRGDMDINKMTQMFSSFAKKDVLIGIAAGAALTMALTSDTYKDVLGKLFNTTDKKDTK